MVARVLGVMGLISVGFLLFLLLTSNPVRAPASRAADGRDLNPLLQDPGMVIHPPMLYMGYVGFSVAFAFAIAALLGGRLDATWARWSRPWTTVAWSFLTIGIALGSWWAYYELGWGGWWFWDPVENASFMPWLVGTALIHSLAVTEKRGAFKSWTVLLAILAFSLSLLGTFLVRSGVLTSVHAFATDPRRGIFILAVPRHRDRRLADAVRVARAEGRLGGELRAGFARIVAAGQQRAAGGGGGSVLLGTLYPLFLDALDLGKISVGPPYFDTVFVPLMAPAGVPDGHRPDGALEAGEPARSVAHAPALGARRRVVTALLLPFAGGTPLVSFRSSCSRSGSSRPPLRRRARAPPPCAAAAWLAQARAPTRAAMGGMVLAHLGIAVFIVGVTLVKGYEIERTCAWASATPSTSAATPSASTASPKSTGPTTSAARGDVECQPATAAP